MITAHTRATKRAAPPKTPSTTVTQCTRPRVSSPSTRLVGRDTQARVGDKRGQGVEILRWTLRAAAPAGWRSPRLGTGVSPHSPTSGAADAEEHVRDDVDHYEQHEAAGQESDSRPVSCLQEGQAYEDAGDGQCNQEVVGRFPRELDRGSVRRSVRAAGAFSRKVRPTLALCPISAQTSAN
jgi:hypothetical protein